MIISNLKLILAGDWLQGPYVYALYDSYKMSSHQIDILFVAGFGSSMLFGTIIGSFADKYGRKKNAILYGILYGLSCLTKHFNNFWILMIGRLLGGMATSILYSAFEAWLVYENNKRGYDVDLLGSIFSHAIFGNSIAAILSGLVAQTAVDKFGFVSPFDIAFCILVIMIIVVSLTWTENFGDTSTSLVSSYGNAYNSIKKDHKIICLGLIQSLFEGAMYTFVLKWTPSLENAAKETITEHAGKIPHGFIFAGFMIAIMIGSSLFKILSKSLQPENFMRGVLCISSICMTIPVLFPDSQTLIFISFLVFESCVGIFWPSMSTMRGKYVPESTRATIMNFFRIPLNLIVVIILTQDLTNSTLFKFCTIFLGLTAVAQHWLYRLSVAKVTEVLNSNEEKDGLKQGDKELPIQSNISEA
ncbi:DgyrCDS12158 [Dimorphilus gyrociliatus]|uniref:DgyrCDS12158 n=1 Tax=Dimorphilus gyrociliatus TaxID=2664684 RepID=A0A7I8W6V9_9ANNE|nr:DgyrCDS12158 [Dimorphilus gyrociliatus]